MMQLAQPTTTALALTPCTRSSGSATSGMPSAGCSPFSTKPISCGRISTVHADPQQTTENEEAHPVAASAGS
eukprot:119063-Prymnesium_polylepis.1